MSIKNKNYTVKYKVIGMMSGTSLDGLDIAYCIFKKNKQGWSYHIEACETQPYSRKWRQKLIEAPYRSGLDLIELHIAYGNFLGECVSRFIQKKNITDVDFVSSHGHTVFHQPHKGFTFQLGDGSALHAACKLPVVCDFRSIDVAHRGQGAPLVPIGDRLLFGDYDVCLNIGGIANMSVEKKHERIAYDVCYANMGMNYLAGKCNQAFDKNGNLAAMGTLNNQLLQSLSRVYLLTQKKRPSLGREGFERHIQPIFNQSQASVYDQLRTFTESVAIEIARATKSKDKQTVLCTGGGTFNLFLMSRLVDHCGHNTTFIVPEKTTIKYKEALIFALLGVLRLRNEINTLKSVTKATCDSSGGVLIGF